MHDKRDSHADHQEKSDDPHAFRELGRAGIPAVATAAGSHVNEPEEDAAKDDRYPDNNRKGQANHSSNDGSGKVWVAVQEFDPGRFTILKTWRQHPGITRELGGINLKLRRVDSLQHILNLLLLLL